MFLSCINNNDIEASVILDDIQIMEIANNTRLVRLIMQIQFILNQTITSSEDSLYIIRKSRKSVNMK